MAPGALGEDVSGAWKHKISTPNGDELEVTLKLKQDGSKVNGTVSVADREVEIKDGKVQDGTLTFATVYERNERRLEVKHSAKVSGDTMKGKTEFTTRDGEKREREWEAKREKDQNGKLSGKWKSEITRQDGSTMASSLTLKQDGNKIAGKTSFNNGNEMELQDGKIQGDEVTFKIVRERNGRTITSKYRGKIQGDNSIKGQVESDWTGQTRRLDWEAKKAD